MKANFPQTGNYTIFSDYQPRGEKEQISVLKTQIEGNTIPATTPDFSKTKQVENTQVNLLLSQAKLKANEQVKLTFDLKEATNNQLITDLQPYLGEKGHLVIIKQSSSLTKQTTFIPMRSKIVKMNK